MAYDPATGDMVLFGGSGNSGDLGDTWTFDGTTWTQLSPATSPPARDSVSMAYDLATGNIVLFGGEDNSGNLSDTWTFMQVTVTLAQGSPTSAIVAYGAGYSGHSLAVTNSTRTVNYTEATSTDSTDVVVSRTGAISAATSLAPGTYTVGGGDSDTNDDTGTWTFSLVVGKASQTITFTSTAPSNATVGATYMVTATGGTSGNAVTFSTMSMCTVSGSTVSFIGAGKCIIDANQAGNADYLTATQVQQAITVGKASQTITFTSTAPSNATVGGATYIVTATGGASGNAVIFSTTSACTVSGSTVSFIGVGKCIIDANQAGDADYLPAAQATQSFRVAKATSKTTLKLSATKVPYGHEQVEHLSVTVLPQHSGSAPTGWVTISESGTRLCTITLASGKGTCTLSSKELKAGTYRLVATYGGSTNFKGSTSAKETVTVAKR